jgi:hypothetical protein
LARRSKGDGDVPVLELGRRGAGATRELWFAVEDEQAAARAMVATAKAIEASLEERRNQMLRQARVWSNTWLGSLYDLASARTDAKAGPWNVCAAAVSTGQAMICASPVNCTLETSGTEESTQRLAKDASRWLAGVWAENRLGSEVAPDTWQDAAVVDVGVMVVRAINKRLVIEKVFPSEVIVSETEALACGGRPFQGFVKKYFPKHSVLRKYGGDPLKADAIRATAVEMPGDSAATSYSAQLIPIYEGWSVQGKHMVAVAKGLLETEDWPYDFVPLIPMYVDRPAAGYFGRGYVQQVLGYQLELMDINDAIDEHIHILANAKWVLEASSGIDPDDLDNRIAAVLTKNKGSSSPELLNDSVVPKDLLEERQRIYDQALAELGLNSWSVEGKEPADRSGVAMNAARQKEQGRLASPGRNFEASHVNLAEVCFALGHLTTGTPYYGKGPADKELDAIDFKKIGSFIKEKPWRVRPYPINALSGTPDEKNHRIENWLKLGVITAPVALSLLELPDVDAQASLISAAREDILWSIEEILVKGRAGYHTPEPRQNLQLGIEMFTAAWLKARRQGVDGPRLDLLDRWATEAAALAKPPAPVAVEQRPGVGLAPAQVEPINVEAAPAAPGAPPAAAPPAPELAPPGAPPAAPPGP